MGRTSASKPNRCTPTTRLVAATKPVLQCCGNVCIRVIQPAPCVSRIKKCTTENAVNKNCAFNTKSRKCPPVWTLCGQTQRNPNCILGNLEDYDLRCQHQGDMKSTDKTKTKNAKRCFISRCNMRPSTDKEYKFVPNFHIPTITEKFYARHDCCEHTGNVLFFENEIQKFKDYDARHKYCIPRYGNQTYGWVKNKEILAMQNCKENIQDDPEIFEIIRKLYLERSVRGV